MSKYFSEEFLSSLPDNHLIALLSICSEFRRLDNACNRDPQYIEEYLNAFALINSYSSLHGYKTNYELIEETGNPVDTIEKIKNSIYRSEEEFSKRANSKFVQNRSTMFEDFFSDNSVYIFEESDFERIQEIINELRNLISDSKSISENHRGRLLERLERMQSELHKKTSDMDRFWGFIGEAGVAIGKFGKDMKPIVDRIRELSEIVWKAITIEEKLLGQNNPINLPNNSSSNSED